MEFFQKAKEWMTPERAAAFQGIGMGLSQLSTGQPVDLSPAYEALQQRQEVAKMRKVMEVPGLMDQFTPQQRAVLASMPEGLATKIIMESAFQKPEPVNYSTFKADDGTVYAYNPADPTNRMVLAEGGQPEMNQTLAERTTLAAAAGLQPGTPEYNEYLLTGDAAGNADIPAAFAALDLQAQAAGLQPGTPEYQEFMRGSGAGSVPAAFTALDMQAQAAGFEPGTEGYKEFMATRGAGLAAQAQVEGKAAGEAVVAAPSDISTAETTLSYIESLRNHPGRQAGTGGSSWLGSIPGSAAKEFQIEVKRLGSGAFMTAIQDLRGMGALSNAEGQTATAAVAALDTEGTEEGFLKRLAEYEGIVSKGLERARKRVAAPTDAPAAAPVAGDDPLGLFQ